MSSSVFRPGGGDGTSSAFSDPFPVNGTAAGFIDASGNMAGGNLDSGGNLKVSGSVTSTPVTASTAALSNVADNAGSVTVLAANANRLAFKIYNDSSAILYVKTGTTASTSSFTEKLLGGQVWGTEQLGVNYTGKVDGIWASAAGGAARVTEFTP